MVFGGGGGHDPLQKTFSSSGTLTGAWNEGESETCYPRDDRCSLHGAPSHHYPCNSPEELQRSTPLLGHFKKTVRKKPWAGSCPPLPQTALLYPHTRHRDGSRAEMTWG
uniref:Uncharacterized protein n=1 Tax=Sphaerodactylus townsendi TaxID=933632 RepID=A0ACB8FSC1_9SAUR